MELRCLLACVAERLLNVVFPIVLQQLGMLAGIHVQGNYFRRKPGGKLDALAGDIAPAVDHNHRDGRLVEPCRVDGKLAAGEDFYRVIVPADKGKESEGQWTKEEGSPCAF